ncbi:MAG TPA: S41 family peptidase [Saprospiraceae bacterium]|nr:S41 family peptidase [Saprospiraceae bacterium]HMP12621.1 S41 family peptidase [Saprospiraceae bacterium]
MKRFFKTLILVAIVALSAATTFQPDNNKYFEITKNIEIFTNLYKELNTYYVDDVDPGKLMRKGIDAMVESLDPFTNYISESDIEGYRFLTEGKYNGIGALSRQIDGYVTIVELYEGQPADKAGLKVGDQILAVDGRDAGGKSVEELNEVLRGFPGTIVELTIQRPGKPGSTKLMLTRGEVDVPNVPYHGMVANDIGYVALTTFTRDAGRHVAEAVKEMKTKNPNLKGIILDLRGNGGGLLNEAVNVANIFIPRNELVVTTKGKVKEWDRAFKTLGTPVDEQIPLAVLIDKGSASASEIVCGVIQDYDRGILLGQRSYGKGLVQNTRDIGYNAKLKLTTAKYYIPSGRCIQSVEYKNGEPVDIPDTRRTPFKTRSGRIVLDGGGVKPDIVLDQPADDAIIRALIEQNFIFDYATNFCLKHPTISTPADFRFTDFDDFLQHVENKNFSYETESEKMFRQLKEKADKDGLKADAELKALEAKIKALKKSDLAQYKETIVDLLEKEIVGRYFYQTGKVKIGLRNDREIEEAVKVLRDKTAYSNLLKG